MATETITTAAPPRSCHHCGATSPTLLRCSQCKLVHYCSRSCQSLAWKNGHRQICRKAVAVAGAMTNGTGEDEQMRINATMAELMHHVQQMDCRTAYENMCRAKDEIERLQKQLDGMSTEEGEDEAHDDDDVSNNVHLEGENDSTTNDEPSSNDGKSSQLSSQKVDGSWLKEGGKCSIEYLPNIKCYHITLTTTANQNDDGNVIIPKRDDLQFTMSPVPHERESKSDHVSQIVFYEMRLLAHSSTTSSSSSTLLSLILPTSQTINHQANPPAATISTDSQSISLRIYLQQLNNNNDSASMDIMDNLLGESSIFSPVTTPIVHMNHLHCRNCHFSIIAHNNNNNSNNNNESTIKSVLPLPSGYWDDIEDYLICYEGQAHVDFNTSSMNAIRSMALEDDAVIVLHKDDVNEGNGGGGGGGGSGGGGVCTTRNVKGYGEHSALRNTNNKSSDQVPSMTSAQLWKDKSAMKGDRGNTITCSNCWSTLGFVSGHDSNTFRFYKHLLHCGHHPSASSSSSLELKDDRNVYSKYTCGSFLAREMVRYADSEAIYTFIVGVSDENDWTRLSKASECVLLHMLGWDSALGSVNGKKSRSGGGGDGEDGSNGEAIRFTKVLKVIYDETTDRGQHSSNQADDSNGTKWTWGGMDLCCPPPPSSTSTGNDNEETSSTAEPQVKATAVRIFLSTQEMTELKRALSNGSKYFSDVVKDAIVMSKFGMPLRGGRHSASLSYLPLIN